nr:DNA replication complex GINS protein PSF3-like [Ipomoea batatas]
MANYYDIDDILAEEELVPAVFQKTANAVGIFDCCDDMNKVGAGMEVEMPFWLARELYVKLAVKIKVPSCFDTKERPRDRHRDEPLKRRDRTKDEIGADAAHVDLRGRCPYFYDFGCKIARLVRGWAILNNGFQEMADGWT